jgi:hypothetical protein
MPSKAADAPAMVVKKIAKTEKIISELRSVKKLTTPSFNMSGCKPDFWVAGSGDMACSSIFEISVKNFLHYEIGMLRDGPIGILAGVNFRLRVLFMIFQVSIYTLLNVFTVYFFNEVMMFGLSIFISGKLRWFSVFIRSIAIAYR